MKDSRQAYTLTFSFICLCFITLFLTYSFHKKTSYVPRKNIIIERAIDDRALANLLVEAKLSDNLLMATIALKITKLAGRKIKSGEYELPHYISLAEACRIFSSGKVAVHKITIPEGFSVKQTVRRLEKNEFLLGEINEIPEEGSLLPDTYCFKYPTTKQQIIFMAQKAMREFIQQEWPRRSLQCTLETPRDALILASIIEKETNIEREMVAGIYLNRLKKRMRLQSCPTIIYALKKGDKLERSLKYSDLKIRDSYNTYAHLGLPPTPITNPGRLSIIAVLHPEETENLFFVFDGVDQHIFSKTFEEHKRNKKLKNLRAQQTKFADQKRP